jgi:hypothetical protein
MIESFKHKGLRQLFEDDNARGVNAEHVAKLKGHSDRDEHGAGYWRHGNSNLPPSCVDRQLEGILVRDGSRKLARHLQIRRW